MCTINGMTFRAPLCMNKFHQPHHLPSSFIFSNKLFSAQGFFFIKCYTSIALFAKQDGVEGGIYEPKESSNMRM